MYGLTTIMELNKCARRTPGLAAVAMAALIFLSAWPTQVRAQNTYGGTTVVYGGTIGLVPGQTVSVSVPNFQFSDGSVRFVKHSIKVYEIQPGRVTENESGLVYSGESGGINESAHELGHVFTFRHEHLRVAGEPGTGRVQVWIKIESFPLSATQEPAKDSSAVIVAPTFELIDPNGRTVIFGSLSPALGIGATSPPTQALLDSFYAFEGFQGGVSVGAATGQTLRILIEAADPAVNSLAKPSGAHVRVFNALTGALLWSRDLTSLTPGHHNFDINRDELREVGNPGTGRIQLWIEVVLDGMKVSLPAFEMFDNTSGKTSASGAAGPMKESMETMKKGWKDAS